MFFATFLLIYIFSCLAFRVFNIFCIIFFTAFAALFLFCSRSFLDLWFNFWSLFLFTIFLHFHFLNCCFMSTVLIYLVKKWVVLCTTRNDISIISEKCTFRLTLYWPFIAFKLKIWRNIMKKWRHEWILWCNIRKYDIIQQNIGFIL